MLNCLVLILDLLLFHTLTMGEESKAILTINRTMEDAVSSLSSVCGNLRGLLVDLSQPPDCCNLAPGLQRLIQSIKTLRSHIEFIVGPFTTTKNQEMSSVLEELEAIRTKYHNLQREWDSQQEHLGRVQGEMFRMRAQLKNQSSFCASMGAIMGSLMWKTTRLPNVVDVLLSTNRVSEFLCIVSGSLESFMETYTLTLPDVSTSEMQFILSLVGIVANMAATPDGRQFLVTDPNGKELIHQMISTLLNIHDETGDCLKRVVLMSLYNLSINQLGLVMLLDQRQLFEEIAKDIESDSNPELRLLSLRLLQSLTMQTPSTKAFLDISETVPMEKIQELTNTTDADMRLLAKSILQSLERANAKFGSQAGAAPLERDRCCRDPSNKSTCSLVSSA